ncbi:helix-turn-helix domain-containing protein [Curtobacterium sp. 314Chir4.1]|nr:helix-turn-helix domain-containing protein [Curtobacterium sp. 314Chir4.1]
MQEAGTHSVAELAELFGVGRATVYRCIHRQAHPDR